MLVDSAGHYLFHSQKKVWDRLLASREEDNLQPTALVVDDDKNIIAAFEQFFKTEQCDLITSTNVEDALEILKGQRVDLLITGIKLRRRSGVTLFTEVRTSRPDLPVIVITGYPDLVSESKIKLLGADYFFLKPLDLEELRAAARQEEVNVGHITEVTEALDVARSAVRFGVKEVHMFCLEDWSEMPAARDEIDFGQSGIEETLPSYLFTNQVELIRSGTILSVQFLHLLFLHLGRPLRSSG